MKRFLVVIGALLLIASFGTASAETWHRTNQATFAWDAVTTLQDGTTIPANDVVRYNVFMKNKQTGVETQVSENILETQATITFSQEGFWYLGAQALRYVSVDGMVPDTETPYTSEISWSSDPLVCFEGVAFGIRFHVPPGQIKNLRVTQ